jgi:poly(3-hydroxybutyrate) depolymerase
MLHAQTSFGIAGQARGPEKLTFNLGFVDLGQIEILVQEGFCSNRSGFIGTAKRNQIERHAEAARHISLADLIAAQAAAVPSGLPAGSATDIPSAFATMRGGLKGKLLQTFVPTIVFHGLADGTVHPDNGAAVISQALHALPGLRLTKREGVADGGHRSRTTAHHNADGRSLAEHWQVEGAGHAWAGGHSAGSYTDPKGPDASRQMLRFFLQLA